LMQQRIRELEHENAMLVRRTSQLEGELKGRSAAYDALMDRLPGEGLSASSAGPRMPTSAAEAVLAAVRNRPAFVTLLQQDYKRVKFWHFKDFTTWVANEKKVSPNSPDSAGLSYRFLEDEKGHAINDSEDKEGMLDLLYAMWFQLRIVPGLLPAKWSQVSLDVKDYVSATLEEAYHSLRYCHDHYKAQQLATINFSWW
ncbi:hypothetical protein EV121DRAFT_168497, partial [Schizophyllum commune]